MEEERERRQRQRETQRQSEIDLEEDENTQNPEQLLIIENVETAWKNATLNTLLKLKQKLEKQIRNVQISDIAYGYDVFKVFEGKLLSSYPVGPRELVLEKFLEDLKELGDKQVQTLLAKYDFSLIEELSSFLEQEENPQRIDTLLEIILELSKRDLKTFSSLAERTTCLNWIIKNLTRSDKKKVLASLNILQGISLYGLLSQNEFSKIDEDLIEFIINLALKESEKIDETLFHASLECVIALNLPFAESQENLVVKTLFKNPENSSLGNAIVMKFNRVEGILLDSCLVMLLCLFSNKATSDFFFTNDLKVLVDVIVRQLQNLNEEEQTKPAYLATLNGILQNNPSFAKLFYKKDEIELLVTTFIQNYPPDNKLNIIANDLVANSPFFQT